MNRDPEISVILPMYNEASVVPEIVRAVSQELQALGRDFELVCVDDGSSDSTSELLLEAAEADPRVVPVQLSRNFGKESAVSAGLELARGQAVVVMDSDLQHPPTLLPTLVARWDEGWDVVVGLKQHRGRESMAYKLASRLFYSLMGQGAGQSMRGSSDFVLLDRQAVDALNACPERHRFFRGLVAWVGFRRIEVPFEVAERHAGQTKWSTVGLVRYSLRNLLAFTSWPLYITAWLAVGVVFLDLLLTLHTLWNWVSGVALSGFTTAIITTTTLGGLILLSQTILVLYISQVFDETKGRPTFIVRQERPRADRRSAPGAPESRADG